MTTFIAMALRCTYPEEESLGIVFNWLLDNEKSDVIRPLMQKHEVDTVDPDRWYSTQILLDVARDIYKTPRPTETFVAIGQKFAQEFIRDLVLQDPAEAIAVFNEKYNTVHRAYHQDQKLLVDEISAQHINVINNTPWPGELIFGAVYWLGRRYRPNRNSRVAIIDPDEHLRTVIEVTWD